MRHYHLRLLRDRTSLQFLMSLRKHNKAVFIYTGSNLNLGPKSDLGSKVLLNTEICNPANIWFEAGRVVQASPALPSLPYSKAINSTNSIALFQRCQQCAQGSMLETSARRARVVLSQLTVNICLQWNHRHQRNHGVKKRPIVVIFEPRSFFGPLLNFVSSENTSPNLLRLWEVVKTMKIA